jgi:hypothetical protein
VLNAPPTKDSIMAVKLLKARHEQGIDVVMQATEARAVPCHEMLRYTSGHAPVSNVPVRDSMLDGILSGDAKSFERMRLVDAEEAISKNKAHTEVKRRGRRKHSKIGGVQLSLHGPRQTWPRP